MGGTLGPEGRKRNGMPNTVEMQEVIRSYSRVCQSFSFPVSVSLHVTARGKSSGDVTSLGMDNVATIIPRGKAVGTMSVLLH